MDREQASINEALLRTDTEIAEPLSDKQPEERHKKDKPEIHVAITKIQTPWGQWPSCLNGLSKIKLTSLYKATAQRVDGNVCQLDLMTAPTRSLTAFRNNCF